MRQTARPGKAQMRNLFNTAHRLWVGLYAGRTHHLMNLAPYDSRQQGWARRDAAHLLWRTQGGASEADITRATQDGLEKTLDRLLTPPAGDEAFTKAAALLRQTAAD